MLAELLVAAKWVLLIGAAVSLIIGGMIVCLDAATSYNNVRPLRAVAGAAVSVLTIIFVVAWLNHDEKVHPGRYQRTYTVTTTTDAPR